MSDDTPRERGKSINCDPAFAKRFGARIRSARVAAKVSQKALGEIVGVNWQQMQKHEAGRDRVSTGTLASIAAALGVHPRSFFFDDMPPSRTGAAAAPRGTLFDLRSAQRIGERILRLHDPESIRRFSAFIDALVDEQDYQPSDEPGEASNQAPDDADP